MEAALKELKLVELFSVQVMRSGLLASAEPEKDITNELRRAGIKVPRCLGSGPVVVLANQDDLDRSKSKEGAFQSISLVVPGEHAALGITLGCIRVGSISICVECGWWSCRIVIKGRF